MDEDLGGEPRMSISDLHEEPAPMLAPIQIGGFSISEPAKKKRGRPRKYGPDSAMPLALSSPASSGHSSEPKRRGRPPGSGMKQQLHALGISGIGFTPHVVVVNPGEDVASKIMAFSQQGPRSICIVSAVGAISNVTLRQPSTLGGTVAIEGRFEILSLSGSFQMVEKEDGSWSRTGALTVSLAGADCRVLGGTVAETLIAASPVQVVVASFIPEGRKPKPKPKLIQPPPALTVIPTTPPSQGTSSELSESGAATSPPRWPIPEP
ncbi:AT-hook motif nuclear-localized protein 10-like [Wolffia australiana]